MGRACSACECVHVCYNYAHGPWIHYTLRLRMTSLTWGHSVSTELQSCDNKIMFLSWPMLYMGVHGTQCMW